MLLGFDVFGSIFVDLFGTAHERYGEISVKLIDELGLSFFTPDSPHAPAPAFDIESVEKIAKEVGVFDKHGSNATELVSSEGVSSDGEQGYGKTASVDGEPIREKIAALLLLRFFVLVAS